MITADMKRFIETGEMYQELSQQPCAMKNATCRAAPIDSPRYR